MDILIRAYAVAFGWYKGDDRPFNRVTLDMPELRPANLLNSSRTVATTMAFRNRTLPRYV